MGSVVSSENEDIKQNEILKKLSGTETISDNDPYWNKLFSFNFNIDQCGRAAQKEFVDNVNDFLQSLLYNTPTSSNFAILIQVFLRRCGELESSAKCENKIFLWQASNSLLIIRHICVFFAQRLSASEFVKIFESQARPSSANSISDDSPDAFLNEDGDSNQAEEFLTSLVDILYDLPVNEITLALHCEAIRVILALLSSQLYEDLVTEKSLFLKYLMRMKTKATNLVRVLLENYLYQTATLPNQTRDSQSESLVISLASSMWSAFQKTVMIQPEDTDEVTDTNRYLPQSLGTLSTALLLNLVCYPSFDDKPNPYKEMLALFQNAQEVSSLANLEASFKLDFTALYNRLCETVNQNLPMLLLYMLLHNNSGFRNFVFSRINLENLVVPIIQVLNEGVMQPSFRSHSHQTYLALIVLLILSEDDFFCKIIHETKLKNVSWYQPERPISEISLGGLIVLVFVKTIHTNTVKTRDRYLHTNSLAALANMSSCFKYLSPLVCQKLIGLLETMTRRHGKLIQQMRENAEEQEVTENIDELQESSGDSLHRDITALEEGIRTILEIINSCLCNNIRFNADLIYSILYKRQLFELYHNHPMFHDLLWNIYMVINHFTSKVDGCASSTSQPGGGPPSSPSVHTVLEAIKKAAIEWPTDRLKKFPDLKFKYIEDENTIDFFVPYVWRLVDQSAGIYFNLENVKIFNQNNT
ncbi:dyggve-Melchior-Clausen syndrome protein [Ditylenchus destructor]|nr:dyggve-Melchior-Clausen syndrome protein [Ditylenchus destructor]